jgi:hypothetical protein
MKTLNYPDITLPDGDKRYRSLEIHDNGDFVFEQTDYGQATKRLAPNGADTDYESWVTVEADVVGQVLTMLIREKFADQDQFATWLKARDIAYTFWSY